MSDQHILHGRMLHPPEPFFSISLFVPPSRNKPITFQSARRHDHKYAKGRLAEAKPGNKRFAVRANQRVDELNVVVVNLLKLGGKRGVATCELEKGGGHRHAQHAPEGAVARHAALAVPEDVDGAEVAAEVITGDGEVTQEGGVIVVSNSAGEVYPERIKGIGEAEVALFERGAGGAESRRDNGRGEFVLA